MWFTCVYKKTGIPLKKYRLNNLSDFLIVGGSFNPGHIFSYANYL
jgi:hypothetical protein